MSDNIQVIIDFLPGYMWNCGQLYSTGVSIPPTQHINPRTGEPCYYVKPVGWACGAFVRRQGIIDYLNNHMAN